MIKPIKSEADYEAAMHRIEELAAGDPAPGTPEGNELEVLATLVNAYEETIYTRTPPTPLEALEFRMEQQGLTPRDLIPFIGSRSKVSEVLAGKRPLSVTMMRALHKGLGIPASVLLREAEAPDAEQVDWSKFPVKEMVARGWLPVARSDEEVVEGVRKFFEPFGSPTALVAMYRKSDHVRSARPIDTYALAAWTARVLWRAQREEIRYPFVHAGVDEAFMASVARLSAFESGPALAKEFLGRHGIALVAEPHLPKTRLDGAAIRWAAEGRPVIGMTLRYDRIDNFWHVLMHELAHVQLHWESETRAFYDDLEAEVDDEQEREADTAAAEALLPEAVFSASPASRLRSPAAAELVARQQGIHPAIVAGRIRRHFGSYRVLNHLVGQGEVRKWFPDAGWSD